MFQAERRRVLHVVGRLDPGGIETQLLSILQAYDRSRFHMDVCCVIAGVGAMEAQAQAEGAVVIKCARSVNFHAFAKRMARCIQGKRYAIVHSHYHRLSGPILLGAALGGAPIRVTHIHSARGPGSLENRGLAERAALYGLSLWNRRWVRRYATHVLGVSQACLDAHWPGWRQEGDKVALMNAGVDTDTFSPATAKALRQSKSSASTIVCVGGFRGQQYPFKRQDLLIRIFAQVVNAVPDARLVLVGGGYHLENCRRLASDLGIARSVDFLGIRDDVPALLRSSAIFCLFSEFEGLPTVLMEAQAAGLCVVATDIGPNREALAPAFHKYLFRPDSPGVAVDHIVRLLGKPDLRARLGAEGREFVLEHFSAARKLAQLQDLYVKWLNENTETA